jgi:ribosomal protein S18 acetylase RimI-like enzyme
VITYRQAMDGIRVEQLAGFFVSWPEPPSAETHLRILEGSSFVEIAFDEELDRVVGFITAISDGLLSAYIPLLEVLPSHQGRGIGTELMRRMLDRLSHLYMIDLLCDSDVQPFYERLGMHKADGMYIRNYQRQSGA